jgi:phage shock protein A
VSDRDAFRAEQQTRRQFGKAKQHEKRLENATYTAAEVRVLTEAALRLGRKEAFDEVFAEIDEDTPDCACEDCEVARREFARRIRSLASLPQNAASDATSVPSEGPGTSEPSKAAKTPREPS